MMSFAVQSLNRVGRFHCASDLPSSTAARGVALVPEVPCLLHRHSLAPVVSSAYRPEGEAAQEVPLKEP